MSQVTSPKRPTARTALALLAATGLLVAAGPTLAQQVRDLRGDVTEGDVTDELLGGPPRTAQSPAPETGIDAPAYEPVLPRPTLGPVPRETMVEPLRAEPFTDPVSDTPTRAPDLLTADSPPADRDLAPLPEPGDRAADAPRPSQRPAATSTGQPAAAMDTVTGDATDLAAAESTQARALPIDVTDETDFGRAQTENVRAAAIETPPSPIEEDPYAPLGLRLGSFVVTPTLEQGIGWTSNATSSPSGGASTFSETSLRLDAVSDWSRHSLALGAEGTYSKSISGEDISELEGSATAALRLDLVGDYGAEISGSYAAGPESASSPVDLGEDLSEPIAHSLSATVGIGKDEGKLRLQTFGDLGRDFYGDAEREGGGTVSQSDRNATLAALRLRAGYEISPALVPFVEGEIGRRFYDERVDSNGYERSADRYGARAGLQFDLSEKLRGEIAAGWLTERPDDDRLDAISGVTVSGGLEWSPLRGTVFGLAGNTVVEGTDAAGESGSILYSGDLTVTQVLRRNLTGTALAGLGWRDYAGSEDTDLILRGEASLTWWLNRYAGVTGRARHEMQRSSLDGRDYDATTLWLGMTMQR